MYRRAWLTGRVSSARRRMTLTDSTPWEIQALDIPKSGKNHDAWSSSGRAIAVADGATPLDASWPQDLKAFSVAATASLVASEPGKPMAEVWSDAISELREQFEPAGYRRTAGVGFARVVGDRTEFATLGDVACLIGTVHGTFRLLDRRLRDLDAQAVAAGWTREVLIANRMKVNRPDGYPIFGDEPAASAEITTMSFDSCDVISFAILTDGAWDHFDPEPALALTSLCNGTLGDALDRRLAAAGVELTDDATIVLVNA